MAEFVAPPMKSRHQKEGYKIIHIEGFGDKKTYYRVCDTVVRNSMLFKNLFTRLCKKSRDAGKSRHWHIEFRERLKENQAEFREFIKFSNRTVAAYEKKIAKLNEEIEKVKLSRERMLNRMKQERNKKNVYSRKAEAATKELRILKNHDRFFSKPFCFEFTKHDVNRAEIMVRAIVAFKENVDAGKIDHNEFLILVAGLHLKAFKREDIVNRYGEKVAYFFKKTIKKYTDLGYINRLPRKELYYITETGRDFILEIVKSMMKIRMNTYYGGIFDDFKIAKRDLSS